MATDLSADEGLPKNPNMEYAEMLFVLQSKNTTDEEKSTAKDNLMKAILENSELTCKSQECLELALKYLHNILWYT